MTTRTSPAHARRSPAGATLLRRAFRRTPWIAGAVIVAAGIGGGAAYAFWQSTDSSNDAGATADTLPRGATPTGSVTSPGTVSVTFDRASTTGGRNLTSYRIRRYDSASATTPVASFDCTASGSSSTVTCTESGIPAGAWYFTDSPRIAGTEWSGAESSKSSLVATDTTPPAVSVSSISPAPNANGFNNTSPVSVNLSATDSGAGVASITYWIDSGSHVTVSGSTATVVVTGDGAHTVSYLATDAAANSSTTKTQAVTIDTTGPAVTLVDPGASLRGIVTLSATAADDGAGVSGVVIQRSPAGAGTWTTVCTNTSAPYTCSLVTTSLSDGLYDLRAVATDNVGNVSTSVRTNRRIDNTNPTASSSVSPAPNANGWNNSPVTVTVTASDSGSGIDKVYYTTDGTPPSTSSSVYAGAIVLTADGSNPVRYLVVDNAGNLVTGSTATIKLDRTAPAASITCPTGSSVSKSVWQSCTSGSGGFTGTAGDSGSGLASVEVQVRNNADSTYWNGSNWVTAATWLSPSGSTTWTYGLNQNKLSNVQYTLSARATDNAGNVFTTSTTFNYTG